MRSVDVGMRREKCVRDRLEWFLFDRSSVLLSGQHVFWNRSAVYHFEALLQQSFESCESFLFLFPEHMKNMLFPPDLGFECMIACSKMLIVGLRLNVGIG